MQHYVKNRLGQLVGWTSEDKNTQYAYDRGGKLLGWYNKKTDHTHDARGRLLTTSGNVTAGLIFGDDTSGNE
jgi:YD repeat-containing protein